MKRVRRNHVMSVLAFALSLALLPMVLKTLGMLPVHTVSAGTLTVTSTADSGGGTLRQAIADAVSGDTINFSPSLGYPAVITLNSELYIPKTLTIQGPGSVNLTVSGNNNSRVFNIAGNVEISGLTIANGRESAWNSFGGCIIVDYDDTLTLKNSTVTSCTATYGGGVAAANGSSLTLNNSTVSDNLGDVGSGAGGGIHSYGTLYLTDSTVSGNDAGSGGGIWHHTGSATLVSSIISGNTATSGVGGGIAETNGALSLSPPDVVSNTAEGHGGISNLNGAVSLYDESSVNYNVASTDSCGGIGNGGALTGTATLDVSGHSVIGYNTTLNGGGGGICNTATDTSTARVTLVNTVVISNSAQSGVFGSGGGILNYVSYDATATVSVDASTIYINSAELDGGGVWNSAVLTITNSTVSYNTADGDGGGLYDVAPGLPDIRNATLAFNVADADNNGGDGGGVYLGGTGLALLNSIVANNKAWMTNDDCYETGAAVYNTLYNLIETPGSCTFAGTGDVTGVDPKLASLGFYGGFIPTHALHPSSPAIDSGTNSGCLSTDQRGYDRPLDGDGNLTATCDKGAYEFGGTCAAPLPVTCGQRIEGNTTVFSNVHSTYYYSGTTAGYDASGPETIYVFTPTGGIFTVTAHLDYWDPPSQDLDVYLLAEGGCSSAELFAAGAYGDATAVAAPVPPRAHYVSIDGYYGDAARYIFDLTCTPGAGEQVYLPVVLRNH